MEEAPALQQIRYRLDLLRSLRRLVGKDDRQVQVAMSGDEGW